MVGVFSIPVICGIAADHEERYGKSSGTAKKLIELPASAYSAEVATSATKAGSYAVFGKGEAVRDHFTRLRIPPQL